ncbi:carbamoyl-phosphate synthase subunit L [Leptospira fletcheri]|uniref:Carbamoyl-phosphate synthase subunit L n=1 Tax=Leptospira fletcheri TaxID=2484981 RepID=A0A4R9GCM3_9LEPT|nr:carboxyl transferase domain-containing protein [Leptospira fletcheri]TGK08767.1 carbamoyl-phosphate synthase subunit L [Leptospira fletcheri]
MKKTEIPKDESESIALAQGISEIEFHRTKLKELNATFRMKAFKSQKRQGKLQKVLVANRGEIAKRFFFALHEEGIRSIAVVADKDRGQSWFEFADEVVYIGEAKNYASIPVICAALLESGANAIYPGYGFLSENYEFVEMLSEVQTFYEREIVFMGPKASVMRKVGNKLDARHLANQNGVPLFLGSGSIGGIEEALREAERIGYPIILKLDAGGGGKGMLVVRNPAELAPAIESAIRIGRSSYGNETFYLEKFIERPAHFEVQIFNGIAVGIRKCAVQRRNQKIIEESGEHFLPHSTQLQLLSSAEKIAGLSGYSNDCGAGTVEFLLDRETGQFGFLEMNTRLQVEYAVTDQSVGVDLVKWQIFLFDDREDHIPYHSALQSRFREREHSIQCRIYAEDPYQNYSPSPGKIKELELPTFNGIRCDFGFKKGDSIPGEFDPMVGKLLAFGKNRFEALQRMERALSEIYMRGITSNIEQLLSVIRHPKFREGDYDNRLLDEFSELVSAKTDLLEESITYACIGESLRETGRSVAEIFRERNLTQLIYSDMETESPVHYKVFINDSSYNVFLLRTGISEFWIGGEGLSLRRVRVSRYSRDGFQFLAESGDRNVSVKIDAKPNFQLIRFFDSKGSVRYSRLKITSEGKQDSGDDAGVLRSPFQGTFVKLCDDPETGKPWILGSGIKKGDSLIVISAMKMETLLKAPVDGTLSYLIEKGDLNRLIQGNTASGQILGKSFGEGEILAKVTSSQSELEPEISSLQLPSKIGQQNGKTETSSSLSRLEKWSDVPTDVSEDHEADFMKKPYSAIQRKEVRLLLRSWLLGFCSGSGTKSKISCLLKGLEKEEILKNQKERSEWEDFVKLFFRYIVLTKRLFSSDFLPGRSHFSELQRALIHWDQEGFKPAKEPAKLLSRLFAFYGAKPWTQFRRMQDQGIAFGYILSAYKNQLAQPDFYAEILLALEPFLPEAKSFDIFLHELLALEERDRDPKLEKILKRILNKRKSNSFNIPEGVRTLAKRHQSKYLIFTKDPMNLVSEGDFNPGKLSEFRSDLFFASENLPEKFEDLLSKKLDYWKGRTQIRRLEFPSERYFLYLTESKGKTELLLIARLESDPSENTGIDSEGKFYNENLENECIAAVSLLAVANRFHSASSIRLELVVEKREIPLKDDASPARDLEHDILRNSAASILEFFLHADYSGLILEIIDAFDKSKIYSFFFRDGKLRMDILGKEDIRFPYSKEIESKNSKMYEKGKWPLERWVEETFDSDSFREIRIPGLDFPENNANGMIPIGAKIFVGKISGQEAVFFFKDSRVAGGATGDKEGRKYFAAACIAYRMDLPLYVWNDGAGANIKEGMVSLNRAAEGFFVNSLLTGRVPAREFMAAIESHNDPAISELFSAIHGLEDLNFRPYLPEDRPSRCLVVAVGVGSSTGLDVYGSSQASIQVLLDEEQSYRVLTGAAVIESVTGERFTNYEIGGAKIMGRGSGTVDFVANDKVHLISILFRIQKILFGSPKNRWEEIAPLPERNSTTNQEITRRDVISESTLRSLSDEGDFLAIKENYSGGEALVAGLLRLKKVPLVVLGPRSEFGFHSYPSLIKAKESLRIAQKTGAGILLVYGRTWFSNSYLEDGESFRIGRDILNLLSANREPVLHIVKDSKSLKLSENTISGDVWILIEGSRKEKQELPAGSVFKTPTFLVSDERTAFSVARDVFSLLRYRNRIQENPVPSGIPSLPKDLSQAYDMRSSIIEPTLDEGTFLEFFQTDPGSSLITGLGRIAGKTVGIIADQPKDGGAPDASGTEKFRIFMEFLSKFELPLVMLSDAPGFVPGLKQERLRIQQIGGESLDINVLSKNPVVSVVLRQNYGGRQIHAFSGFLRPGISYCSMKESTLAVMGAFSAFDLFHGGKVARLEEEGKKEEVETLRKEFLESFRKKAKASQDALSTGVVDQLFDEISELRGAILEGLLQAEKRCRDWNARRFSYESNEEIFPSCKE